LRSQVLAVSIVQSFVLHVIDELAVETPELER